MVCGEVGATAVSAGRCELLEFDSQEFDSVSEDRSESVREGRWGAAGAPDTLTDTDSVWTSCSV